MIFLKDISIIIGGEAGYGVESLSKSLSLFFMREGFCVFSNSEYENRIRGGHIYSFVRVGSKEITGYRSENIDILLSMDKIGIEKHQHKVKDSGIIIYDPAKVQDVSKYRGDIKFVPVEMQDISTQIIGMTLARNVVGAGAVLGAISYNGVGFKDVLTEIFKKKGEETIKKNHEAFDLGLNKVKDSGVVIDFSITADKKKRFLMHGNEAIVLGSIKAGMKYLSAYPMTPGSSVMTTAAKEAKNYNILVSHVEDEIAAICNIIGAGYAGVRAMTSTSGGGFALMGEALGLAGMIEAPCVIVNAQRPGPSTGLPTMTAQGDLMMAINCGQGNFPRLVIAPGDHEECIHLSFEAFNFAEKYQLPVIILTEKYLADSYKSIDFIDFNDGTWKIERGDIQKSPDENFKRFEFTDSGISKRSIPGMEGLIHTVTSYEHNEFGKSEENEDLIIKIAEKRQRKIESLGSALPMPKIYGDENADIALIGWGATKGILVEVIDLLKEKGIKASLIHFQYLFPFKKEIENLLKKQKRIICVETNIVGQLACLISQETGIKINERINFYHGRQVTANEVLTKILSK